MARVEVLKDIIASLYIGMCYEDAVTLAILIEKFGLSRKSMELYEEIRMPRVQLVSK